jgi:hypothetical protein
VQALVPNYFCGSKRTPPEISASHTFEAWTEAAEPVTHACSHSSELETTIALGSLLHSSSSPKGELADADVAAAGTVAGATLFKIVGFEAIGVEAEAEIDDPAAGEAGVAVVDAARSEVLPSSRSSGFDVDINLPRSKSPAEWLDCPSFASTIGPSNTLLPVPPATPDPAPSPAVPSFPLVPPTAEPTAAAGATGRSGSHSFGIGGFVVRG